MDLAVHLRIAGTAIVALGLAHAVLPRALGWRTELAGVSALTRQIAYVHSAYIGLTCVLLGAVPAFAPELLLSRSPLAAWVLAGLVAFWGSRLVVQNLVYDRAHWRGDAARTVIHGGLTVGWTYETVVYAAGLLNQLAGSTGG